MREKDKCGPCSWGPAPDVGNLRLRCQLLCSLIPARLYLTRTAPPALPRRRVPWEVIPPRWQIAQRKCAFPILVCFSADEIRIQKTETGFRFNVDVLPSCTRALGPRISCGAWWGDRTVRGFPHRKPHIDPSSGATLQEIRRHEVWDYGALLRAQSWDKWLRWAHSRVFTQRPYSRKAVRVDDCQDCHRTNLLAHALRG